MHDSCMFPGSFPCNEKHLRPLLCVRVYSYRYIYIYICIYICIYIYKIIYIYVFVCVCLCLSLSLYIYIYIYTLNTYIGHASQSLLPFKSTVSKTQMLQWSNPSCLTPSIQAIVHIRDLRPSRSAVWASGKEAGEKSPT